MKILILTLGSRGDVQPFVALGKGLKNRGHAVTLCTCSEFAEFIAAQGLDYAFMSNEFIEFMDSSAGRTAMESGGNGWGWLKNTLSLAKRGKEIYRDVLKDAWKAAQATQPDFLLFHPKVLGGKYIAAKLGVSGAIALPLPALIPTTAFPAPGLPQFPLGGWYNKLTYKLLNQSYRLYNDVIQEFCHKTLELPLPSSKINLTENIHGQPLPTLHAYSPSVCPRPADWPETAYVTGYWFLDREEDWQPPAALQAFLKAGEAPVYVGFGSISGRNPQKTAEIAIAAIQKAGVRGILATGWGGLEAQDLPPQIFKLKQAPHNWLFPQMAAVVHHGGAGTTAAGLRAGRPTIICPFFGDQPFWGEVVYRLGVGPKPIPQQQLTADNLAAAIRETQDNEKMGQSAIALGEKIAQEDGIANATAILENIK